MTIKELYKVTKDLNILYAEDEQNVREQYSTFFKKMFNSVDTACDGQDGLEKYNQYLKNNGKPYDLVISDISMPRMNGIELCKNILQNNSSQQILIISAYNDSDKLQSLMELGLHYFIHKPMNIENITKVLDKVCSYIIRQREHKQRVENLEKTVLDLENRLEKARHDKLTFEEDVFSLYSLLEDYTLTSLTDKDGKILEINHDFETHSGYKLNELLGKSFDCFRDEKVSKDIWDAIENVNIYRGNIKNKKANSETDFYWTDLIVVPMIRDEEVYGYKFIEEDISEDKKIDSVLEDIFGDGDDDSFDFDLDGLSS